MDSKSRIPAPHLRQPPPGPGIMHPEQVGPGLRPPRPLFPQFDMLPPPEIVEKKLAAQHVEMQKLATENQRLADTHGTLRQELASAQYELHVLHAQIDGMKSDSEQQMRFLTYKIAKMEDDLKAADPIKKDLQQARGEAQILSMSRQELITKVQQLNQDLQMTHSEVQQLPIMMSELEGLRQEYHHCRASLDYEKKLYAYHLESVQVMEKNYVAMAREVERLRAELSNTANVDRRTGGTYNATPGSNENGVSAVPVVQNAYEDSYAAAVAAAQGLVPVPAAAGVTAATGNASGVPAYGAAQTGQAPAMTSYDATRLSNYHIARGPGNDASAVSTYDTQRAAVGFDAYRGPPYDPQAVTGFVDAQRAGYETQRVQGYDPQRGQVVTGYDPQSRGHAVITAPQGHVAAANTATYASATPPTRNVSGYDAQSSGGNPVRR